MSYIVFGIVLVIAFYSVMFSIETWKEKNHMGSIAIYALTFTAIALPFYMLFLRG